MVVILIKSIKCKGCTGDIYPIIHGGYYANIDGEVELEEYPYCHAQYTSVDQMAIFSNGDLLLKYFVNFINLDSELNLNGTGALIRIDFDTGKTIWAIDAVFEFQQMLIGINSFYLIKDVVYCFLLKYHNQGYLLIILKLDEHGKTIESFTVVNNPNQSLKEMLYFIPEYFFVEEDDSLLVFAETIYHRDIYGVSEDSKTDVTLLKFDSLHDVEWTTSFDLLNMNELASNLISFNSSFYISFNSDSQYMCIASISEFGLLLASSCIKSSTTFETQAVGRFKLLLISSNYSFGVDIYYQSKSENAHLMAFSTDSLALIKIFAIKNFRRVKAFLIEGEQNKYVFIHKVDKYYRKITIDDSFNADSILVSLFYEFSSDFNCDYLVRDGDKLLLSYTYRSYYGNITLQRQTITQILDFDLTPVSCQTYTKQNEDFKLEEIPFGVNEDLDFYYDVVNRNISNSYYK